MMEEITLTAGFTELLFVRNMLSSRKLGGLSIEQLETRQLLDASAVFQGAEGESEQVADFALLDVNPTSPTYNQTVSPQDYLGQVSAWYFGHST